MAKKWSQKTAKTTLVNDDEFLIVDSEDAVNATMNKRVKVSTLLNSGPNTVEFQTVGATNQQQAFIFNGAITMFAIIAANNVGNTKGYAGIAQTTCTLTNTNFTYFVPVSDFATADVTITTSTNTITLSFNGEAGETINWKAQIYVVKI
jgi:hypothetical protein